MKPLRTVYTASTKLLADDADIHHAVLVFRHTEISYRLPLTCHGMPTGYLWCLPLLVSMIGSSVVIDNSSRGVTFGPWQYINRILLHKVVHEVNTLDTTNLNAESVLSFFLSNILNASWQPCSSAHLKY
eukprot:scaffold63532_cov20-Prasinocladus_malaysianus.AAC.1